MTRDDIIKLACDCAGPEYHQTGNPACAISILLAVSGEGKTCLTCRHSTPGEWCAQNVGRPYDASGFGCVRWEAMPAYDPAQHQTGAAPQEDK